MSQSNAAHLRRRPDGQRETDPLKRDEPAVEATEVVSLLSDEYAREVLRVLVADPLSARDLVDRLDMSRATVYRRLDRLESAGVLESSLRIDPEGHHRKRYRVVVDRLQFCVETDGLRLEISD
jgi:DNA-binding transcriptional ArsR family regulator